MSGKSQELYERVIDRILSVLNQAGLPPPEVRLMVSDYELAILNAMKSRFGNGRAHGCYFHIARYIYRTNCIF